MLRRETRILGAGLAGLVCLMLTAGPASAHHLTSPLDKSELKCRGAIAKAFGKAVKTADKVSGKCHKARDKDGTLAATDCNDLGDGPNQADVKGKFQKARTKIEDAVTKKCVGLDGDILSGFRSCPEPCSTDEGLPNPMTSLGQAATCLGCLAGQVVGAKNELILGSPTSPLGTKDEQKCHYGIAKGYGKYLATIMKSRIGCQKSADKEGVYDTTDSGCSTDDSKGKIAKAQDKAEKFVDKFCTSVGDLSTIDSCDNTSTTALKSCLLSESDSAGAVLFADTYELPITLCPIAAESTIHGNVNYSSRLDIGWTGLSHGMPIVDQYTLSADLDCPGSEAGSCGDCDVLGVSALGSQYQSFTRCTGTNPGVDDPTIECDVPFTLDPKCNGSMCAYFLGPPLPISAGNNPTCNLNAMREDITGTANPDSGASEMSVKLKTRTYTGGTATLTRPCPVCLNDTTPMDGVKDGTCKGGAQGGTCQGMPPSTTCSGGPNDTQACTTNADCPGFPCDTQGVDATFGPAPSEGFSLDCPPAPLTNISGDGLTIDLALTTGTTSLSQQVSCDAPLGILDCWCGVCTGNTALPCSNDMDCSNAGFGSCSSFGSGIARQPNDCDTLTCNDQGGGVFGLCDGGPDDSFCDGLLRENGDGFLQCNSDSDCASINALCGGNCGTCNHVQRRKCFLNPIQETGVADPENPILVSAFCLPPTSNSAINGVAGVPGPARAVTETTTRLIY
jgi:hypothetical protein